MVRCCVRVGSIWSVALLSALACLEARLAALLIAVEHGDGLQASTLVAESDLGASLLDRVRHLMLTAYA
jgi:hypothetical protein